MKSIAFIAGLLMTAVTWAGTNSVGVATRVTPPGPTGYVVGNLIKSSEINGEYNDIYTELTDRVSRSGKGYMLANLAMNSYKLTGLAAGSASGDSVEYSQLAAKANAGANTDITSLNGPSLGAASATAFTVTTSFTTPIINTSQGADIASAATINLETATGQYSYITGTATITDITLGIGHIRDVKFSGSAIITHGGNIILPTPFGYNITAEAGDTATFVGEALGVVRCTSYTRANGRSIFALTSGANTSLSGTSVDITGIPTWAKRITIIFTNVAATGTSKPLIQVGDGSIDATSYASASSTNAASVSSTSGFVVNTTNMHGHMVLTPGNGTGTNIIGSHAVSGADAVFGGGRYTAGHIMDRVRITTTTGTDTLSGTVTLLWE